jgi:pimeloyl-ACP methyl ester carboxylesterase
MTRHRPASFHRPDGAGRAIAPDFQAERDSANDALFVIGGLNGFQSVQSWVTELKRHSRHRFAHAYSWRDVRFAESDIVASAQGKRVTLIGHSLGGGHAELLSQQLPAGTIHTLITVAPYGPRRIDHDLTRRNVGRWLNIISAPARWGWRDLARNIGAPLLLNWREQGFIASASENYRSEFPHHDFHKLMTARSAEHGQCRMGTEARPGASASEAATP